MGKIAFQRASLCLTIDDRARWRAPGRVPLKRARQQPGPDHLVPLCLEEARSGRPRLQTGRGSESPSPTILFRVYPRMAPTMKIYTGVLSNPICAAADNLILNSTRTIGSRDRKHLSREIGNGYIPHRNKKQSPKSNVFGPDFGHNRSSCVGFQVQVFLSKHTQKTL